MPQGCNAEWDSQSGSYIFHSYYDFDKFKPLIIDHFEHGRRFSMRIFAGLLGVSRQTIQNWMDPAKTETGYYKPEFRQLIEEYQELAAYQTEKWHQQAACGELEGANTIILRERHKMLIKKDNPVKIRDKDTLTKKLDAVYKSYEEEHISIEETKMLIDCLRAGEPEAVTEALEKALKRFEEQNG